MCFSKGTFTINMCEVATKGKEVPKPKEVPEPNKVTNPTKVTIGSLPILASLSK